MDSIDTHHTHTRSDLEYFANIIGSPGHLPQLPLHLHGPLDIQYSVIEGTTIEKADRFAKIATDMRRIAKDQALKFGEETTSITSEDKHHRAVLTMPNGKVTYTAVWIEHAVQVANGEPCGDIPDE